MILSVLYYKHQLRITISNTFILEQLIPEKKLFVSLQDYQRKGFHGVKSFANLFCRKAIFLSFGLEKEKSCLNVWEVRYFVSIPSINLMISLSRF
jgi:hypothetical protein